MSSRVHSHYHIDFTLRQCLRSPTEQLHSPAAKSDSIQERRAASPFLGLNGVLPPRDVRFPLVRQLIRFPVDRFQGRGVGWARPREQSSYTEEEELP